MQSSEQPSKEPLSRFVGGIVAMLAALAFVALLGARHQGTVSRYVHELDVAGRWYLVGAAGVLALLSGILVAVARPRRVLGAFLAGVALPALIVAADVSLLDSASIPKSHGLPMLLAPVSTIVDMERRDIEKDAFAARSRVEGLEDAVVELRGERAALQQEAADLRGENGAQAKALEGCRAEVIELSRRGAALQEEGNKLRKEVESTGAALAEQSAARRELETALAAARKKADALDEARAEAIRLQVQISDLEARLRVFQRQQKPQ